MPPKHLKWKILHQRQEITYNMTQLPQRNAKDRSTSIRRFSDSMISHIGTFLLQSGDSMISIGKSKFKPPPPTPRSNVETCQVSCTIPLDMKDERTNNIAGRGSRGLTHCDMSRGDLAGWTLTGDVALFTLIGWWLSLAARGLPVAMDRLVDEQAKIIAPHHAKMRTVKWNAMKTRRNTVKHHEAEWNHSETHSETHHETL